MVGGGISGNFWQKKFPGIPRNFHGLKSISWGGNGNWGGWKWKFGVSCTSDEGCCDWYRIHIHNEQLKRGASRPWSSLPRTNLFSERQGSCGFLLEVSGNFHGPHARNHTCSRTPTHPHPYAQVEIEWKFPEKEIPGNSREFPPHQILSHGNHLPYLRGTYTRAEVPVYERHNGVPWSWTFFCHDC